MANTLKDSTLKLIEETTGIKPEDQMYAALGHYGTVSNPKITKKYKAVKINFPIVRGMVYDWLGLILPISIIEKSLRNP